MKSAEHPIGDPERNGPLSPFIMNIRVLLVESEPQDAIFLRDVLAGIEAERHWKTFAKIATAYAPTWSAAAAILAHDSADLLLLDCNLADSRGIDTFRRAKAVAPQVPVILLVD